MAPEAEPVTCNGCGHIHTPSGCAGDPTPSDVWAGVSVSACDCMELRDCWGCGEEYDANDADEAGQCLHAWYCRPCWLDCDRGRSCRDGCHERGASWGA